MKLQPDWLLPDLEKARKRTQTPVARIDSFVIPESAKWIGRSKKYYISTYGCQANERDSETLRGILESMGYVQNEIMEAADLQHLRPILIGQGESRRVISRRIQDNQQGILLPP